MDSSFDIDLAGLHMAVDLLARAMPAGNQATIAALPRLLPEEGCGDREILSPLAEMVLDSAMRLDAPTSFAHMDPPTPWLTWAMALWNARLNQNLLHRETSPAAGAIEERLLEWLVPYYGMDGGHCVPGSTVANLTSIWAAREIAGITRVAAPDTAHLSIAKAAHILGLEFLSLPTDERGRLRLPLTIELERTCLVLVAGSTSNGSVDPLLDAPAAAWLHVDAAWAGPLRLCDRYADRLAGIEKADSIAISGHKWLFQPKESALVLFRDSVRAHAALSFGGAYLASPNVGLLGSRGATALPLLALLWAWGRQGVAARVEACMANAERFAQFVSEEPRLELLQPPETGIVVWRPGRGTPRDFARLLPRGLVSITRIDRQEWLRCVAANPNLDLAHVLGTLSAVL